MTSTTLITFMVYDVPKPILEVAVTNDDRRCPPTTSSVSLMGSWDNFKTPYPMKRDSRVGPEHWSGCHSFSNIICDGKNLSADQPRDGGLKMGGTYWYYYKLDDDIEFHNSVEPSTTRCALLPGQLVNELHVPVVLSGNRSRNASFSSTSSEKRTMNPSDKFINPRPVPKPQLSRLKTSPTLLQQSWGSTSTPASALSGRSATSTTNTSEPGSASTVKILRLARKSSLDPPSRSNSRSNSPGSALSNGLRSAFRSLRSPRSGSPDVAPYSRSGLLDRQVEPAERGVAEEFDVRQPRSLGSSRDPSPNPRSQQGMPDHDLAFRRLTASPDRSIESAIASSFQQHRRQRSRSREPSSLRNSLVLEESDGLLLREVGYPSRQPLSTLKEVASAQNTPGIPSVDLQVADLEKRLPTLPNSPSSAYPPSTAEDDAYSSESPDMENLQSHFSITTIDTSSSVHSSPAEDSARFSCWSSNYALTDCNSTYATSLIDEEPMSALLGETAMTPRSGRIRTDHGATELEETPNLDVARSDASMPTALSSSTVSSTTVSSLSTSPSESNPPEDSWMRFAKRDAPEHFYYQQYRLPADDPVSAVTLKQANQGSVIRGDHTPIAHGFGLAKDQPAGNTDSVFPHSSNMQQLLDDLSYLGDMIHQR